MKYITILLVLISFGIIPVFGQSREVKFLIDTSITIMKSNAVNRNKIDWKKLEAIALSQSLNKENAYQLGPIYRKLFESLNDFHGAFYC
jgi:carboxyl-terminal processing protease